MSRPAPWVSHLRSSNVNNENQQRVPGKSSVTAGNGSVLGPRPRQALAQATNTFRQMSLKAGTGKLKSEGDLKPDLKQKVTEKSAVFTRTKTSVNDENAGPQAKSTTLSRGPLSQSSGNVRKSLARVSSKTTAVVERPAAIQEQCVEEAKPLISFSHHMIPDDVEDIDANDGSNVLLATEYVADIYAYLRHLEKKQSISANFLSAQKEMTPKMRSVLVDWLVNVHHQFKLLPESLYMGIWLMDRFFQSEVVSKDKIQLVGVTAFFIATKYEEIYPPDLSDFVAICDSLYSKKDILKMEMVILRVLKFEIGRPLPLHFLRRFSKAGKADPKIHTMAKYIMELSLLEHTCSHWSPSLLAAAALYVTLKVLADSPSVPVWTPTLCHFSNYSEQQLQPFAADLCKLVLRAEKNTRYPNIRKKYSSAKQYAISLMPELTGEYVQQMAGRSAE